MNVQRLLTVYFALQVTGAQWQPAKQPVSPCPTLKVIGFVTAILDKQQELQKKLVVAKPIDGSDLVIAAVAAADGAVGGMPITFMKYLLQI